ncbi:MAG: Protein of unknown function (DUF3726) [Rhodobacteraceae bacterium HLUCCO07]|nr:MAG: Protein of unknown function (DUF3726) [Rhodobacteraceae bacterium HLUCCO07]
MPDCTAVEMHEATQVLHLSLSEIGALSLRAIRGAGRTWGEAEEGAAAACWLARAGLDWANALIGILSRPASAPGCPLRAGMAIADSSGLSDGASHRGQRFSELCHPGFLLPFCAYAAARSGQTLRLNWKGATAVIAPGEAPTMTGDMDAVGPLAVRLEPHASTGTARSCWPRVHLGTVEPGQYAALNALMLRITVPTSADSLAGAGARGSDND